MSVDNEVVGGVGPNQVFCLGFLGFFKTLLTPKAQSVNEKQWL